MTPDGFSEYSTSEYSTTEYSTSESSANWAMRLAERLKSTFVGRAAELDLFREMLRAEQPPFQLLAITGPPGSGKTTLLKMFASLCDDAGVSSGFLDLKDVDPTPDTFLRKLYETAGIERGRPLPRALQERGRFVLMLDNYDKLLALHDWLVRDLLPNFPDSTVVVVTSRTQMSHLWRPDSTWQDLVRFTSLDSFSPDEARRFLTQHAVPAGEHDDLLRFTRGHPLALSLVADVYNQRKGFSFVPEEAPDIMQTLVRRFVGDVDNSTFRAALEACALLRVTNESIVATMLGQPDARAEFEWLCRLSFVQFSPEGIYPHDLVRDALTLDLLWRNPNQYYSLKERASKYFLTQLQSDMGTTSVSALDDYLFLHRDHQVLRQLLQPDGGGSLLQQSEPTLPRDHPRLLQLVEEHEGEPSARILSRWLQMQPYGAFVVRDDEGEARAFMFVVRLDTGRGVDVGHDPITQSLWEWLRQENRLDVDGAVTIMRFLVDAETYQEVSPRTASLTVALVRHYLTVPNLQFAFNVISRPERWDQVSAESGFFLRAPEFRFEVGEHSMGVFMQDWRREPPGAWLARIAPALRAEQTGSGEFVNGVDATAASATATSAPDGASKRLALPRDEFTAAVRQALKNFHVLDVLASNALIRSNIVNGVVGQRADVDMRVRVLRDTIARLVHFLGTVPTRENLYRALHFTYLEPQGSQERTAEFLAIPFSTYRGHLRAGIAALTDLLWNEEIIR